MEFLQRGLMQAKQQHMAVDLAKRLLGTCEQALHEVAQRQQLLRAVQRSDAERLNQELVDVQRFACCRMVLAEDADQRLFERFFPIGAGTCTNYAADQDPRVEFAASQISIRTVGNACGYGAAPIGSGQVAAQRG